MMLINGSTPSAQSILDVRQDGAFCVPTFDFVGQLILALAALRATPRCQPEEWTARVRKALHS
jgi:hypothetical protein